MKLIENKTKITKKDILNFLSKASTQNLWLVGICAVVIALLGFNFNNGTLYYGNFFFLIASICTVGIYFFVMFLSFRKQMKNFNEIENQYVFGDEGLEVTGSTGGITEKFDVKYHNLYQVKETKKHYYLFVNNYSALIISKDQTCYSHGDADKLKKLLSMKLTAKQNHLKKAN